MKLKTHIDGHNFSKLKAWEALVIRAWLRILPPACRILEKLSTFVHKGLYFSWSKSSTFNTVDSSKTASYKHVILEKVLLGIFGFYENSSKTLLKNEIKRDITWPTQASYESFHKMVFEKSFSDFSAAMVTKWPRPK